MRAKVVSALGEAACFSQGRIEWPLFVVMTPSASPPMLVVARLRRFPRGTMAMVMTPSSPHCGHKQEQKPSE
jgi:hypothetical protein